MGRRRPLSDRAEQVQITRLELLAPARNADIGIAAIDCGADAVYIAGPAFGARAAAGNAVEDIDRLCRYAHRYGAKVHATVNTLLTDEERPQALALMQQLYEAGVDVFIVQDLSLLEMPLPPVELHASTQTAIRTPERARELEALGFSRLVLERQLSLEEIRAIRAAVGCELEFFIHGALCVGYSGECYLSQQLAGRSANRGVCAQVCRSRYDLIDASGRVIVRDRPLLSPRDLRFDKRLPDLVAAGICSFKIEGRLKNASYVKNVVRYYRQVMDDYAKTSVGRLEGGFTPDPDRTFQRGYTEAFLDGRGEKMASEDAAKSLGEFIGQNGEVTGRRVEVASGERIQLRDTAGLEAGMRIYRNFDIRFERELEKNMPKRVIDVKIDWRSGDARTEPGMTGNEPGMTTVLATVEDGLSAKVSFRDEAPVAEKPEAAVENLRRQLGKHTGPYAFSVASVEAEPVRFYPASFLNGLRRDLADELLRLAESRPRHSVPHTPQPGAAAHNISTLDIPNVLLRSRYCIKWELGLCTKRCPAKPGMTDNRHPRLDRGSEPLYLVNQGNRLRLQFDCKHCEMSIVAD